MRIGAMSAYGMQPYIYNTNALSGASMNRLSGIPDDVLERKVDYSELSGENTNPLRKGQTLDFQSMLTMQLQKGQNNAARVMKPAAEPQREEEAADAQAERPAQTAGQAAETAAAPAQTEAMTGADNGAGGNISYRMQQALNAYEMFMTA